MIEYVVLFIFVTLSISTSYFNAKLNPFFIVLVLSFVFMTTFRYGIGNDYFSYVSIYENAKLSGLLSNKSIIEPGYYLLNVIAKLLGGGFQLVSFLSVSLVLLNYIRASKNFGVSIYLSIPLYIALFGITHNFNIVRHAIATSFVIYAFSTLDIKSNKVFFFNILIACTFHVVAIFAFFLYFLKKIKINILVVLICYVVAYLLSDIIFSYTSVLSGFSFYNKIEYYQYHYAGGISEESQGRLGLGGFLNIIITLTAVSLSKNNEVHIAVKLLIVGVVCFLLFRYSAVFSERLAGLFYPALIFVVPILYGKLKVRPKEVILIVILFYSGLYFNKNLHKINDDGNFQYLPYRSVLY